MVAADEVDLFAALRPELDGSMLQVRWTEIAACAEEVSRCRPWPWAFCSTGAVLRAPSVAAILARPVLWFWLGAAPSWVPAHRREHLRWSSLLEDVRSCLDRSVGGLCLAPDRGLLGPRRELVLSPGLEALVASHPRAMRIGKGEAPAVARVLARHRLPLALVSDAGGMRLEVAA